MKWCELALYVPPHNEQACMSTLLNISLTQCTECIIYYQGIDTLLVNNFIHILKLDISL